MQQLTIRMPEEYFYKIELIAKSSGLKKSDIARMAIRKFLEEYSGGENTDLYSKAKRLVGVVESGISDLGQNHRDHLVKHRNLMKKYADLPMDFADATLACLSAETGMQNIVTFDQKDFAIYKLPKDKSFTIIP